MNIIRYATAGAVALALAACSTSAPPAHHASASNHPATHSAVPSSPSAAQAAKAAAAANDRSFIDGIAGSTTSFAALRPSVAGPVMTAYAWYWAIFADSLAATGTPGPADAITAVPGGYQLCAPNGSGGTFCETFTGFQHDAAGRITGLSVDGQPVAGRIATGPPNQGAGLAISHVVAYKPAATNEVYISFKARNTSSTAFSLSPPWLATFSPTSGGSYSEDDTNSAVPSNLQPGESAAVTEVFGTTAVTGTLRLLTNDQTGTVLAITTLTKP
jgi:hypothetical protein